MLQRLMLGAAVAVLVSGCASDRMYSDGPGPGPGYQNSSRYDGCNDNAAVGTVVGAVAGGVIGNQFGKGSGNTAATVGGVILGGIAGNAIARDACRNERADAYYYNRSYYDAFEQPEYGRRYEWRNPHNGNYGYVTPTRRSEGRRAGYGRECREFSQIVYVNGRQYEDVSVACRDDNGSWRIVAR
ncbi:MAG: glycine zipper 2TM domain-containing protein [Micropepsaceae bacterium]